MFGIGLGLTGVGVLVTLAAGAGVFSGLGVAAMGVMGSGSLSARVATWFILLGFKCSLFLW